MLMTALKSFLREHKLESRASSIAREKFNLKRTIIAVSLYVAYNIAGYVSHANLLWKDCLDSKLHEQ